ncbi:MAG: response regulator transcription factor [Candidatus Acidiferrales bacterium]
MTGSRVLVADDIPAVLYAVDSLISPAFEVIGMVSDGKSALEGILAQQPDLAILDISMPGLSGIEVARELRNRGNTTKIVFLTVHDDADIVATCRAAGGLGYVLKPMIDTDLIPAMKEALAGRAFVSQLSSQ